MSTVWGIGLAVAASVALVGSGAIGDVMPGWRVSQDCTPAAPGDTSGSVGSASVDAAATSTSVFAIDNDFTLTDSTSGSFKGNVVGSPVQGGKVHLDVAGKLNFLVADRTAGPVWFDAGTPKAFAPIGTAANGAPAGTVATPGDIAIDPYDNSIFVSSTGYIEFPGFVFVAKYIVIKYDSNGNYVTHFGGPSGDPGSADGQFGGATSIAVSPVDGSVAVGDAVNSRFQIFTPNALRTTYTYSTKSGTAGSGNGQFLGSAPMAVAYDSFGALYASDSGNARIQKFTILGATVTYVSQVATPGFGTIRPIFRLYFNSADVLYAALAGTAALPGASGTIRSYNTSLVEQNTWVIPAPPGTESGIRSIAADSDGLWISWGNGNFLSHYVFSNLSVIQDKVWYSGFGFTALLPSYYRVAVMTTGEVAVLFGDPAGATVDTYGAYRGVTFNWQPVPLSDAIENYMRSCDDTLGGMSYSYDADDDPDVVFPVWSGDVWSHLKEICAAFQVEIYPDGNTIRVADIGSRTVEITNHSPLQVTPTNIFGGQQIVVVAQNPRAGGGIVFDASTQNTRFQINVGQSSTVVVNTLNYPVSVDPLVPTSTLPVLPGQYYVLDSTGLNVPADTWTGAGGSVVPALGDNPGQVRFTLQGPASAISGYTGPFTFADSLASTGRAALTLTGAGTFTNPQPYTFDTGANPTKTTTLIARTIDSFAIADITQVAMVTPAAIEDVSGVTVTVTFQMPAADLNGFGLTPGSLFYAEDSRYRIRSVSFGGLVAEITAVRHVTINDIDTAMTGLTFDQQDAIWVGYSNDDRTIRPLALTI